MPKGKPNKRYTPEFKIMVVETMHKEKLSHREAAREFDVSNHNRVYLQEFSSVEHFISELHSYIACSVSKICAGMDEHSHGKYLTWKELQALCRGGSNIDYSNKKGFSRQGDGI